MLPYDGSILHSNRTISDKTRQLLMWRCNRTKRQYVYEFLRHFLAKGKEKRYEKVRFWQTIKNKSKADFLQMAFSFCKRIDKNFTKRIRQTQGDLPKRQSGGLEISYSHAQRGDKKAVALCFFIFTAAGLLIVKARTSIGWSKPIVRAQSVRFFPSITLCRQKRPTPKRLTSCLTHTFIC